MIVCFHTTIVQDDSILATCSFTDKAFDRTYRLYQHALPECVSNCLNSPEWESSIYCIFVLMLRPHTCKEAIKSHDRKVGRAHRSSVTQRAPHLLMVRSIYIRSALFVRDAIFPHWTLVHVASRSCSRDETRKTEWLDSQGNQRNRDLKREARLARLYGVLRR